MQATNHFVARGLPACFQLPILIPTNAAARPAVCQQLLPCACLNTSTLQQLKLQNFAVPGVCRQAGSTQTTLQIKGLSILYQGTGGEQWEVETFRAQACSVQRHNAPGTAAPSWKQGWREKKSFLTKRPETPILPQPWCSSSAQSLPVQLCQTLRAPLGCLQKAPQGTARLVASWWHPTPAAAGYRNLEVSTGGV